MEDIDNRLVRVERILEFLCVIAGINMTLMMTAVGIGFVLLWHQWKQKTVLMSLIITTKELLLNVIQYFQMLKEMVNANRLTQNKIKDAAEMTPVIAEKIDKMPEATATRTVEKVVEVIKSGDSKSDTKPDGKSDSAIHLG